MRCMENDIVFLPFYISFRLRIQIFMLFKQHIFDTYKIQLRKIYIFNNYVPGFIFFGVSSISMSMSKENNDWCNWFAILI